jgi:hypothetical protein
VLAVDRPLVLLEVARQKVERLPSQDERINSWPPATAAASGASFTAGASSAVFFSAPLQATQGTSPAHRQHRTSNSCHA